MTRGGSHGGVVGDFTAFFTISFFLVLNKIKLNLGQNIVDFNLFCKQTEILDGILLSTPIEAVFV